MKATIERGAVLRGRLVNRGPYENPFPIDENTFCFNIGMILLRDYDGTEVPWSNALLLHGFLLAYSIRGQGPAHTSSLPQGDREPQAQWSCWMSTTALSRMWRGEIATGKRRWTRATSRLTGIYGYQFPLVSCGATYATKSGIRNRGRGRLCPFSSSPASPSTSLDSTKRRTVQRMRTFTSQPGEASCIGCHADRNASRPPRPGSPQSPRASAEVLQNGRG